MQGKTKRHSSTYHTGDSIHREVARSRINDGATGIDDPLDVGDQGKGGDDVQPEEEAILEVLLDHGVDEDLQREEHEGDQKERVEVRVGVLVRQPHPKVILQF